MNHGLHKLQTKERTQMNKIDAIYKAMNNFESILDRGYWITRDIRITKKSDLISAIDNIYSKIPDEILRKKEFIIAQNETNIFSLIQNLKNLIDTRKSIFNLLIINYSTTEKLLDKIYELVQRELDILEGKLS